MKRNNKGFMLVEVIVASTVVVVTMIFLYTTFSRLYNGYKVKNTYFNLDATYATKEMIDAMINDKTNMGKDINTFVSNTFSGSNYGYIINDSECSKDAVTNLLVVPDLCQSIKTLYDVNKMIFVEYDENELDKLTGLNQTFIDYIDYLKKYYNIDNTEGEYTYIVLTETLVNGKNYYGSLRVR